MAPSIPQRTYHFLFGNSISAGFWTNIALLLLRLHVGIAMARGGIDKLPVPEWFVEQVAGLGFPAPAFFALLAALAEFAGGLLLAAGLFTRPAAIVLAFTIGVAAFGFHRVSPIITLNITQVLFWSYVLFSIAGGGRFALDQLVLRSPNHDRAPSKPWALIATLLAMLVTGYGFFKPGDQPDVETEGFKIESLSLAGTFNDWDLKATPMSRSENGRWIAQIDSLKPGIQEFKFVANGTWDANAGEIDQQSEALPLRGTVQLNDGPEPSNIRMQVTTRGNYQFTIDPKDMSYTVAKMAVAEDLIGEWQVDLRPTPDAPAYFKSLMIESVAGNKLQGRFYDTEIEDGRINTDWSDVLFTFITKDGGGSYYSTAKLVNGRLEGTTHSPRREMLSVWTAERTTPIRQSDTTSN